MPQRNPAQPSKKPAAKSSGKNASGLKGRAPAKKPGRSIVNQRQTPWTAIIIAAVLVVFAGGIIGFAVTRHHSGVDSSNPYTQPELAAAKQIPGVVYKPEPNHTHVEGNITYDATPPIGGNHSQYWGDCTGTVYPNAIANENAVHMLEHGAVWVTYNKDTITSAGLAALTKLVKGVNGTALSPFPNLKTPVSLQAWGYQLFVNDPAAQDKRIAEFINTLRLNPKTTPEQATCSDPSFIQQPSTFGHPLWAPPSSAPASVTPSGSGSPTS